MTQLFWYKFIFALELITAEGVFLYKLERRSHFVLRLVLAIVAIFAAAYLIPIFDNGGILNSLLIFFSLFFLSLALAQAIFKESFLTVLFCGIAGYALQHIAYQLFCLIANLFGMGGEQAVGLYGKAQAFPLDVRTLPTFILIHVFTYIAIALFFGRKIKETGEVKLRSKQLFFLLFLSALSLIVVNMFIVSEASENYNFTYIISCNLYGALCAIFILALLFALLANEKLKLENEFINRIRAHEQKTFKLSKNNIELINVACHDLKYQLRLLKQDGMGDGERLNALERAVEIFDSKVETENDTLNVILTARMIECYTKNVKLNCMVNGKLLSFMNELDLYTLFGNALDNALEAVLQLGEDKRVINVVTSQTGSMFSVLISNYCARPPMMVDGLPVSTKSDGGLHGYGLKSIKRITEKYGGDMRVRYDDGIFNLSLLFSL